MEDHLSKDDSDYSEGDDNDSLPESQPNNNVQIMNLFASYYGIENPNKENEGQAPKGTIDDANFEAGEYVKVVLLN
jgi:hypothetical protein